MNSSKKRNSPQKLSQASTPTKKKKSETYGFNRFSLFSPPPPEEKDLFLNSISRKITLLTLRVSHIENRLADYETRAKPFNEENYLKDPPFAVPMKDLRRSSTSYSSSPSAKSYISSTSNLTTSSLHTKSNIAQLDISSTI